LRRLPTITQPDPVVIRKVLDIDKIMPLLSEFFLVGITAMALTAKTVGSIDIGHHFAHVLSSNLYQQDLSEGIFLLATSYSQ
jgi:hypothetical protein